MNRLSASLLVLLLTGCASSGASGSGASSTPSEARPRSYGAAIDEDVPFVALSEILAAPHDFIDRRLRTAGVVHRVCQRMGCWMELREGDEGTPVPVPMAGHAFFLPFDCAGERATIEGYVRSSELSPEARAHHREEGATALSSTLSIEATGVRLEGR